MSKKAKKKTSALTPRQLVFCQEYLKDLNGTQAAIRAGYSKRSAEVTASRMLSKAMISEFIKAANDKRLEKVELKADVVLQELLNIARVDISLAFDDFGNILPIKLMPENVRRAIAGIEVFEEYAGTGENRINIGQTKKIKFWDKNRALELLGKHLALFIERVEGTIKHNHSWIEEVPEDQLKRAAGKLLALPGGKTTLPATNGHGNGSAKTG